MSWLDELSDLERRARARLLELERMMAEAELLVAEYHEVRELIDRLGAERAAGDVGASRMAETSAAARGDGGDPGEAKPAPEPAAAMAPKPATASAASPSATVSKPAARRRSRKPAAKRRSSSGPRKAAKPGERERQLLTLVTERPGITVQEAATELGVDPTGLYTIVRRLQSRYQIIKNEPALEPAGQPAEPASA
jgi:hypothetical protein